MGNQWVAETEEESDAGFSLEIKTDSLQVILLRHYLNKSSAVLTLDILSIVFFHNVGHLRTEAYSTVRCMNGSNITVVLKINEDQKL